VNMQMTGQNADENREVPFYNKNLSLGEAVKWLIILFAGSMILLCLLQGSVLKALLLACLIVVISPLNKKLPIELSRFQVIIIGIALFLLAATVPAGNRNKTSDTQQGGVDLASNETTEKETEIIADEDEKEVIEEIEETEPEVEEEEIASLDEADSEVALASADKVINDSNDKDEEEDEQPKMQAAPPLTNKEKEEYLALEEIPIGKVLVNIDSYLGQTVKTTVKVRDCYDLSDEDEGDANGITQIYTESGRIGFLEYLNNDVWLDDIISLEEGDCVTVACTIEKDEYDNYTLMHGRVLETGDSARKTYEEDVENYKAEFKSTAESVSHDTLLRYPDSYKGKIIKITVKITKAEPDGLIFQGDLLGVVPGTNNEIDMNDYREVREPRFREGDKVTVYGFGDGLTTMRVYDTSTLIPKLKDKYDVPCISIWYID